MEPVRQWPAFGAPYNRVSHSAAGGSSHVSVVSGNIFNVTEGRAATPSTTSPQLLVQAAMPATPLDYNSALFNQQTAYQQNSTFSSNGGQYHQTAENATIASNPYYEYNRSSMLMSQPTADSVPLQMGFQPRNVYVHAGPEITTHGSTLSKSTSVHYDKSSSNLFGITILDSQSINYSYNEKSLTLQQCGVPISDQKDFLYSKMSHPYEASNTSPLNNNSCIVQQTSKKSVTHANLSPSSLSPLSMSTASPTSDNMNVQHHDRVQHRKDQSMSLNLMNSKQLQSPSSPARSHNQAFNIHSSFPNSLPQPITKMNSRELQSSEFASKAQSSSNVLHSLSPNNNLYEQCNKSPAHASYQHVVHQNQHNVYNNHIDSESSSPSSPLTFPAGSLPAHSPNLRNSIALLSDLSTLDHRSSFQTAFDRQMSPASPAYQLPPYKDAEYASSPQQGCHKVRSENMGAYSPCSRRDQGSAMCAVTSPMNTQFQSSPRHVNSPSYPSHNSPVTLSSASQPTYNSPNLSNSCTLLGGLGDCMNKVSQSPSSLANIPETNLNGLSQLKQQAYWQDSNHNLQKADINYSEHSPSPNSGKLSEKNTATDYSKSYLQSKLHEETLPSDTDPISSKEKATNIINEKSNYLPTDVMPFNVPQPTFQRNSNYSQSSEELKSKNSIEQNVSNYGSSPFQRSSPVKLPSYADSNQIRFTSNAAPAFQNASDYTSTASVLPLPNSSPNLKHSHLNQIPQRNSSQQSILYGDSNSYYNSSTLNENNPTSLINDTNMAKNGVSHSPLNVHSPCDTISVQQKNNVINSDAKHVKKEIYSNTLIHPTVEKYALDSTTQQMFNKCEKNSIKPSLSNRGAASVTTSPFHNVDQSLMVSQPPSSNQIPPNDLFVHQTHPLNDSQSPLPKLSSISIPTENSSYCSSTCGEKKKKKKKKKKNDKTRVVVPPVQEQINLLAGPVGTPPVVSHYLNQKPNSTRRGRPPKNKALEATKMPEKKLLSFPPAINNGFMASYIKFLEGIQYDSPDDVVPPPRRERSTRKAKQKSSFKRIMDDEYEDADDFNSVNSDSDPAWSPAAAKDDSDEDFDIGRKTRSRSFRGSGQRGRKRGRQSTVSEMSSDDDDFDGDGAGRRASKQKKYATRTKSHSQTDDKSNDSDAVVTESTQSSATKSSPDSFPFQVGEFVINKTEVNLENPPIWRVDGKTLLQKYEAVEQKGETVYKNIPTYAGWTHLNNDAFQRIKVKIKMQTRNEIVVQLLPEETKVSEEEQKAVVKFLEETVKYQDNFEIYIQTLISQALDSNFLAEIIQENDEYFLDNVKTIDKATWERRQKLIDFAKWQDSIVEKSMATWPCIDVLQGTPKTDEMCASCNTHPVTKRVIAYGQPYNNDNLEGCPADPAVSDHKDFLLCKKCIKIVTLYNKIVHQKYLMFMQCANKVQEKRNADPTKDTTVILNELLADEPWLSQLFKDVRTNWAEVERFVIKTENVETNN